MAKYKWFRQGGAGGTSRTTQIQIAAPASRTVEITRIFAGAQGNAASGDNAMRVELIRMTTASTGGSAAVTPIMLHPNDNTSRATVKDSSTAFTFGTAGDVLLTRECNQRGNIEYVPRDDQEKLESAVAGTLELSVIQNSAFAVDVEIEWEE